MRDGDDNSDTLTRFVRPTISRHGVDTFMSQDDDRVHSCAAAPRRRPWLWDDSRSPARGDMGRGPAEADANLGASERSVRPHDGGVVSPYDMNSNAWISVPNRSEVAIVSAYSRRCTTVCFRQAPHGPRALATCSAPMRRGRVSASRRDDMSAIRTIQPAQSAMTPRVCSTSAASGWSIAL